jgi:hypothetical protein
MRQEQYRLLLEHHKAETIDRCPTCCGIIDTECSCFKEYKRRRDFLRGGITEDYWDLTLSNLRERNLTVAKAGVADYIKNLPEHIRTGRGLYISGRVGTIGKSTLGQIILKEAVNLGYSVHVTTIDDIADAYSPNTLNINDAVFNRNSIEFSHIVLINDIGDVNASTNLPPYLKKLLIKVYTDRSKFHRPTLFASALSPTELDAVFGKHLRFSMNHNTTFLGIQ